MNTQIYDWQRYWYRRDEGAPDLDGGFLRRIESELIALYGRDIGETFESTELLDIPCLILLGDPGIGKSYAIKDVERLLSNTLVDRYGFFNFSDYDTLADLIKEVFSENDDFKEWVKGNFNLHIFLDGLDEAPLQITSVVRRLYGFLKKYQTDLPRLRLRIVCRLANWPVPFEEQLMQLWSEEEVQAFILAPLQRQDVVSAAEQVQINVNGFLKEIEQRGVTPFAARPITLRFLIDAYKRSGHLPSRRAELYLKGCKTLCTDFSDSHAKKDRFEPEERFLVASRIAAYSIFARRRAIHLHPSTGGDSEILTVEDCSEGQESVEGLKVYVHRRLVEEVLKTALFQDGDPRQWAHQTYAEFLAAWYVSHTLETAQIRNLLFHSSNRLIPQLVETAAWITAFNSEIWEMLLKSDPEVLLQSDVATGDKESRTRLTQALLEWRERDPHSDYNWKRLSNLKHEGLGQLLKPYIQNKTRNTIVRRFAMEIAVACQSQDLLELLVAIALDENEQYRLRVVAARGIASFGDPTSKAKLRPLALLPYTSETPDLKRYGIQAAWPAAVSPAELFSTFKLPAQDIDDQFSSLDAGLNVIPDGLQPDDLPIALGWVQQQDRLFQLPYFFSQLVDQIIFLAWKHLEYPRVGEAFALTLLALWSKHTDALDRHGFRSAAIFQAEKLTEEMVRNDTLKRAVILRHLLRFAKDYNTDIVYYFEVDIPFITFDDTPLLIEIFNDSESITERALAIELIRRVVNIYEVEQFEFIYEAGSQNAVLWHAIEYQLFIELESQAATKAKESHKKRQKWEQERKQLAIMRAESALDPSPVERAEAYLEAFNEGDKDAWWQMSYWMIFNPNGSSLNSLMLEPDMTQLPVWNEMDDETQRALITSAPRYLEVLDPEAYQWRAEERKINYPIVAGCRALHLLLVHDSEALMSPQLDILQKWVPATTYYYYRSRRYSMPGGGNKIFEALWRILYLASPESFIETLLWIIDKENETDALSVMSHVDALWDKRLEQELSQKLRDEKLTWRSRQTILEKLAMRNFALVEPFLKKYMPLNPPADEEAKEQAYVACSLYLFNAANAGWPIIWPLILQDTGFGVELMRRVAGSDRRAGSIQAKLDEQELADTYIWMFRQFNPANDPRPKGVYRVTTEIEVAGFRDSMLRNLISRNSEEGIRQLMRIQSALDIDLGYELAQAEILLRRNTWKPITVKELKSLAQDRRTRWIQSEEQLLDHIMELLDRLNQELQGRTGATSSAIDLWNENKENDSSGKRKTKYRPKDENRLSDYIERFLKRELEGRNVFVSRETQIQRGNFTDIYIETFIRLPNGEFSGQITLVVEVKGCWHEKLMTAMADQLADQYLEGRGLKHGIYLVGIFFCDQWDQNDNRQKKSPKVNDNELQGIFEDQAMELARNHYMVRPFLLNARLQS